MLRRHPIRRASRGAALAAVAGLALTACGSADDGDQVAGSDAVAATVDGQEISVGDVQRSTRELRSFLEAQAAASGQQPQQLDAASVVTLLAQAPGVLDYAKQEGIAVPSAGSVRKNIAQVLPSPSDATVDFLRANTLSSQLDESARAQLVEHLDTQHVTLSPRYASASGQTPDWLETPVAEQQPMETP